MTDRETIVQKKTAVAKFVLGLLDKICETDC